MAGTRGREVQKVPRQCPSTHPECTPSAGGEDLELALVQSLVVDFVKIHIGVGDVETWGRNIGVGVDVKCDIAHTLVE